MSTTAANSANLTEHQIDTLSDAANRTVNDINHENLCACDAWPEKCISTSHYFQGAWDTGDFEVAMPVIIGLWESMCNNRNEGKFAECGSFPETVGASRLDLEAVMARTLDVSRQSDTPEGVDQDNLDHLTDFDIPMLVAEVRGLRIELGKARTEIANHQPVLRKLTETRARVAELEADNSKAIADRDTQIIAWLMKKAGEYQGATHRESAADAIARMADKIRRGAVR
ncbi:hypothetical protein ABT282_08480 [Streptomyces sp. NPDC000927]|uniref:hypothetical protein n=1 Tax=Streptomyces sp. NPDC000927 TaxID=3154371 RepID=UPI0033281DF4